MNKLRTLYELTTELTNLYVEIETLFDEAIHLEHKRTFLTKKEKEFSARFNKITEEGYRIIDSHTESTDSVEIYTHTADHVYKDLYEFHETIKDRRELNISVGINQ